MTSNQPRELIENSENLTTTYLGTRDSRMGVTEKIGIPDNHRNTHVLSIGATGTGKTQAMVHGALQDIHKGRGLCYINPKGDAINQLLRKLPEAREDDIIYINPSEQPVTAINPLQPHTTPGMSDAALENQKEIIVGDILAMFKRLSQNWGDQWPRILSTVLRAHLDLNLRYDVGNTLADVLSCITDDDALNEIVDRTDDPTLRSHLIDIRDNVSDHALLPLKRRIQDFLGNDVIRRVIDGDSHIDFYDAISNNKIILVDVQRGEIGRNASPLIGSMVLTQVWAAAQARIALPVEERSLFGVYVDEVKHYASESSNFDEILSESREYGLAVWMATQYLDQLDPEMQRAAVNNCRTKLVFQPEIADDGTRIANMLVGLDKGGLQRLGQYRAAMQHPDTAQREAVTFGTFPPWTGDRDEQGVAKLKQDGTKASDDEKRDASLNQAMKLGPGGNAGDQLHTMLLRQAQEYLEARPAVLQVNLLHQDVGDERPDGEIIKENGDVANLEAEVSTLSNPAKVLKNVHRAAADDRKAVFIVEQSMAPLLESILADPTRQDGDYYTGDDGEPFTAVDVVEDAETRVLVRTEQGRVMDYGKGHADDCPELDEDTTEEELQALCLHRDEDGYCSLLDGPCVVTAND